MKEYTKEIVEKLKFLLSGSKKIVILSHHHPDGDAIGGSLGLYHTLKDTVHEVYVVMPSKPAEFLIWLPALQDIVVFNDNEKEAAKLINEAEIIFCIDFNEAGRVERVKETLQNASAVKILLDHHPGPDVKAEFIFSDTSVSSASELVYEFIVKTGLDTGFNKDAATCIYTGIMTDTLNFSVNSSRTETFKIVGDLLSYSIDKDFIYDKVYNNFSIERLHLVGYLLYKKLKVIENRHFAYILFTKEEQKEFNFIAGDHEGIVNMPLSVSDIKASLIALENDGHIKLSLRSKGEIDVNQLARQYFDGGGHKNAAGGKIYKSIEETEDYIIESVNNYLKNN